MSLAGPSAFLHWVHAAGMLFDDRYRLGPLLGGGRMALVYRARDAVQNRDVALKIVHPQLAADEAFVKRFLREARTAASLSHPSIVPIYAMAGGERPYIVMELADGTDLMHVLAERGRLPVSEALRIAAEVGDGLQAAHDNRIVHGDIKPSNILVTSSGDITIADFGMANAMGKARLTQADLTLGDLNYASPEQIRGKPAGPPSDVYALGVVLYEMLTGVLPFDMPATTGVAPAQLDHHPSPPSAVTADLPRGVDDIVLRALARRPVDRFASARAMAEAIRTWWRANGLASRHITTRIGRRRVAGDGATDRSRRTWPLILLPVAALLVVVAWLTPLVAPMFVPRGDVLGETAGPGSSAVAAPQRASPVVGTSFGAASASQAPTEHPVASSVSTPTSRPTAPPRPKPTPTPKATLAPTPGSTLGPAGLSADAQPTAVVAGFYNLIETGRFDEAASLWSARMRQAYPPKGYVDGRFAMTTRIDLVRDLLVAIDRDAGTALVAVDLIEYRTVEPSPRRFVGSWDLVLTSRGWRMDEPHF